MSCLRLSGGYQLPQVEYERRANGWYEVTRVECDRRARERKSSALDYG